MIGTGTIVLNFGVRMLVNWLFKETKPGNKNKGKIDNNKSMGFLVKTILKGGIMGSIVLLAMYPYHVAYTKMVTTVRGKKFYNPIQVQNHIRRTEGYKGLFTGYALSAFGIFFYRGLYFALYDSFAKRVGESILSKFLVSMGVTILVGFLTFPLDLVRKRMIAAAGTEKSYADTKQCVKTVTEENGIIGFWKGAGTNIARGLVASLALVVFDNLKAKYWIK